MRGHQKIRDVRRVNFTGDSSVVAGRARVLEYSTAIGSDPDETEDSSVEGRCGGAKVVDGQVCFVDLGDRGQMERRVGSVADSNDGFRVESGDSDEVVMGWWWVFGRAEGANVNDGALKCSS